MNLVHLKYAVEVEKTRSISKAAENLFMGQPNLSRAIRELEESLGITVFHRTSRGISVTPQGEEFLTYAKRILRQVEEVESYYRDGRKKKITFSVSVPRATYISAAFARFAGGIDQEKPCEIVYKETNAVRAIQNILQSDYRLGIIRFQQKFDKPFRTLLEEKALDQELITEFHYVVLMSENNPLAQKDQIVHEDLKSGVEIAHADPYVPSLPMSEVQKAEYMDDVDKRIFVFERASQFDLLQTVPNTFMWVSPIPQEVLDQHRLVQKPCPSDPRVYRDVLIYRKGYRFTELDNRFVTELYKAKQEYI